MRSVRVGRVQEIERKYQRQTCYLVTWPIYNGGRRAPFKYLNQCQLFRESLKHNHAISASSDAIAMPLFPLFPSLL